MDDTNASWGTSRKRSSKLPASDTGHSTRAVTSSSRSSSILAWAPSQLPPQPPASAIMLRRASRSAITRAALRLLHSRRPWPAKSARSVEAVALGLAVGALVQHLTVDHLVAQQYHQPMRWPNKFAARRSPAHALGNGQVANRRGENFRQRIDNPGAAGHLAGNSRGPLSVSAISSFSGAKPCLRAKPMAAGDQLPSSSFALSAGRPNTSTILVLGLEGEVVDFHRQPARRWQSSGACHRSVGSRPDP